MLNHLHKCPAFQKLPPLLFASEGTVGYPGLTISKYFLYACEFWLGDTALNITFLVYWYEHQY